MDSVDEQAPELDLVRDALRHLYDNQYLERHPLVDSFFPDLGAGGFARSKAMRKLLLDAIESTRPAEGAPANDPTWRYYRILSARYIDSQPTAAVMRRVALGHSQYHEEHRAALEAVTCFLLTRDRHRAGGAGAAVKPWGQHTLLHREMSQVAAAETVDLVRVDALLRDVLAMFEPLAQRRGIEFVYRADRRTTSLEIYARRVILRQLIIQILGKLVERATKGPLVVELNRQDESVQLHLLASPLEGNAGLDSATRELAATLGATLKGRREGASVRITLSLPTERRLLALLIDNDPDLPALFRRYLVGQNWRLAAVQSADQGPQVAAELLPDVIILDVIMPESDGWDLLARLRRGERTAHIPIIVCSVLPQPELALTLGADMFMAKPVDQFTLLQALRQGAERFGELEAGPPGPPAER